MTANSPRALARAALRRAIRNHPDMLTAFPQGSRAVGSLTIAELLALAAKLSLNGPGIMREARSTPTPSTEPDEAEAEAEAEGEGEAESEAEGEADADTIDPVDAEVAAIRDSIMREGFSALDERLRDLVRDARKPATIIEVPVTGAAVAGAVAQSRPLGRSVTWKDAFGVMGTVGQKTAQLWDRAHPDTPSVDPLYVFPERETVIALTQIARGRNVYAFGPAGTGKTEFGEQLAARLGRPYALISCDAATDGPTLVGMTVPNGDGVGWQDGQLTRAIQTPGCVICIDEPSIARPGALFVLQNVLAKRILWLGEREGRRIPVAPGVVFLSTDNTAGLGGGARRGYTDTNRLNAAYLDRFGARVRFQFLPEDVEARVICSRVAGCPLALAELLVKAATLTRAAAEAEQITSGLGLRRLFAWAELLSDGINAGDAFEAAVLHATPEQDQETLRQQCALAIDEHTVAHALGSPVVADPSLVNPSPQGRRAAADFKLS